MPEQDIPQLNPNDSEAYDKTVFIQNNMADDKTIIQPPPQYSSSFQADDDTTIINTPQKNQSVQEDNDATVILNKPYISTQEADDATVINTPQKNQSVQEDNDNTVILNKPYIPTQNTDEATIILGKQPLFQYNADEATQILPQQTRPVFQTPQNIVGDNDTTIISKSAHKSVTQAEKPTTQPSESVFSKHGSKILIGVAGLLGILVGTFIVLKPTAKPTGQLKQISVQPMPLPIPQAAEIPTINPESTQPMNDKNTTPTPVAPAPVMPNIKKNLPKTNPSKSNSTTTFIPPTSTPTIPPKAEIPKVIEDNPDQPFKPVEQAKPTATATPPTTYKINELSQIPEFSDIQGYFKKNVTYPNEAKRLKIKGAVFILVTIESNGNVSGAKVLKGLGNGCDEEALEAVRKMPKWKAGKANGQPVRSEISVRVPFQ